MTSHQVNGYAPIFCYAGREGFMAVEGTVRTSLTKNGQELLIAEIEVDSW